MIRPDFTSPFTTCPTEALRRTQTSQNTVSQVSRSSTRTSLRPGWITNFPKRTVRMGYNYEVVDNNEGLKALVPEAADPSLGTFSSRTAPQVFITGITPFLGGVGGESAYFYHWNSFQAYD